ncbi:KH homology domain-containing protein 4-like [Notolabrus celidotus]|uniref:KH homology domain-containing protein 4-like n=1 Tax=Notolabrus celidotus TaxID=1203425 RepID=UPI0014904D1C|nr:KH homology domain-containing protein 4-like [Notolabrus celidotus]
MSSGMTGQTPCLTSRWDQPAQPKQNVDVSQQRSSENAARPVSLPGVPSNSSVPQPGDKPAAPGGVEMAAAMAAKINAMLMAKGKLLTPPPLLAKTPSSGPAQTATEEMVVTEVDINDVPLNSRDLLTKGKTQEEIRQCSGAVVSTKGHYISENDRGKGGGGGNRPLYLHVQGKNQDQVNKAVMRIKEIISEDVLRASAASGGQQVPIMPALTLYPQPPRPVISTSAPNSNTTSGQGHRPAAPHSGSFVHTKIFVGLDQALPSFNVNEKVEGPGGTYLSHIQTETGARVFLRGKTSGYIEQASKRESFEPLYVYISHPNASGLEAAKKLTESLLETVRAEHGRMVSVYTATGSTQSYPAHGFPPNSNYSTQGSWYNYPANGYAGGYSAYPGAGGYWSNANGPPSHSNMSTNPPSSQAMVQYPVCPRKPHPYLVQDPGSSEKVEAEESLNPVPESGSPKRHFQEGAKEEQPASRSPESPAHRESAHRESAHRETAHRESAHREAAHRESAHRETAHRESAHRETAHRESAPPASNVGETKVPERVLMPPPPPPFVAPPPVARKRTRDAVTEDPASPPISTVSMGVHEEVHEKKSKVDADASGLVPYGGDSSDEEEERTRSSKTDNS